MSKMSSKIKPFPMKTKRHYRVYVVGQFLNILFYYSFNNITQELSKMSLKLKPFPINTQKHYRVYVVGQFLKILFYYCFNSIPKNCQKCLQKSNLFR